MEPHRAQPLRISRTRSIVASVLAFVVAVFVLVTFSGLVAAFIGVAAE